MVSNKAIPGHKTTQMITYITQHKKRFYEPNMA